MADSAGALEHDFEPRPFWIGVLIGAGIITAVELYARLTLKERRRG